MLNITEYKPNPFPPGEAGDPYECHNINESGFAYDDFNIEPCTPAAGTLDFSNLTASDALALFPPTAGITYFNETIFIDDQFTVDTDIIFDSCNIEMGPCAQIIFEEGVDVLTELRIERSDVYACSNHMWDGIAAYEENHLLTISRESLVRDAYIATHITECAQANITGTTFRANILDIALLFCDTPDIAIISQNTFDKSVPIQPFDDFPTYGAAVVVRNMESQTLEQNDFIGYLYPISSYNGDLHLIENNVIHPTGDGEIAVTFYNEDNVTRLIRSEGNTYQGYVDAITNTDWATWGIIGQLFPAVAGLPPELSPRPVLCQVDNDTYQSISRTAIDIRNRVAKGSFVRNSSFNFITNGIVMQDVFPPSFTGGVFYDPGKRIVIENNTMVDLLETGVLLTNIHGSNMEVIGEEIKLPRIEDNNITFRQVVGPEQRGIRVENGSRVLIKHNTITGLANLTSPGLYRRVKGISTSDTRSANVVDNEIYKMGDGIHVIGINTFSQWHCNRMEDCYRGFNFDDGSEWGATGTVATLISNQGAPDDPTDNKWVNNVDTRVIGSLNLSETGGVPIKWYYRSGGIYFPEMYDPTDESFERIELSNTFELCIEGTYPNPGDGGGIAGIAAYEDMVDESIEYPTLNESFKYKDKDFVYRELSGDESLMGESLVLANFYELMEESGLACQINIHSHMREEELEEAIALNSQWITENLHEANSKTVNTIYLNSVAIGEPISEQDSATLESIALTTPYLSGDAVYSARVLLNIDASDNGIAYRQAQTVTAPLASIYPNPSNGEITISFTTTSENNRTFNCYDISGKQLLSKALPIGASKARVDLSQLSTGIYMIQVEENGAIIFNEKLILTK